MEEMWVPVIGYEGFYEVSDKGNVRSVDRLCNSKTAGSYKRCVGKVLRQITTKNGYKRVNLSVNQKRKTVFVHRLVAEAFVPNPNHHTIVNHKDENPSNNCADNLEWCTYLYNANYGSRNQKGSINRQNKGCRAVIGENSETGDVVKFKSLGDADRHGFDKYCIWSVINKYPQTHGGVLKTYRGYKWRYENREDVDPENKRGGS